MNSPENKYIKFTPGTFPDLYKSYSETFCNDLAKMYVNQNNEFRTLISEIFREFINNNKTSETKTITLASKSPRRYELLVKSLPGMKIKTINTNGKEIYSKNYTPRQNTLLIAMQKMFSYIADTSLHNNDLVVITADTIVELPGGQPIGKLGGDHDPLYPFDSAVEKLTFILNEGKNKPIKVHTAYVMLNFYEQKFEYDIDTALLKFNPVNDNLNNNDRTVLDEIKTLEKYNHLNKNINSYQDILRLYVNKSSHKGKAGGFNIGDRDFFLCVKEISGDPATIIGLPLMKLSNKLLNIITCKPVINKIWPNILERDKIIFI